MLKIIQNDYYFKAGGKVYTYKVIGSAAEVDEYILVESARRNIAPEQVQKTPDGAPIFWLSEQNEYRNGRVPQKTYNLRKSFDGLRFNLDTSIIDNANAEKLNTLVLEHQAKILAERRMGIGTQQPTRVATPAAPKAAPAAGGTTIEEEIGAGTGEQEEPVDAGMENLDGTKVGG